MQGEASQTDMAEPVAESHRIAIIGAGSVGSAIAYALLLHPVAGTVLLVDLDEKLRRAQVQDLNDAAFYGSVRVKEATTREAGQADIIVISAGAKQRDGETRLDLVGRNLHILKSVLDGMQPIRKDAVLLLVANPVDVLAYFAQKYSGLPRTQVLGTGTFLDTVRLRGVVAEKLGVRIVNPQQKIEMNDPHPPGPPASDPPLSTGVRPLH
jgi:L-lactate dehydrogenase